jgi:hypothetical protein
LLQAAEFQTGIAARFFRRHSGAQIILNLAIEMELQLGCEPLFTLFLFHVAL